MGASTPPTSLGSPLIVKKLLVFLCFDYLHSILSRFEGPPLVVSCGIFWTKLCDSRLISRFNDTFYLMSFTFTRLAS